MTEIVELILRAKDLATETVERVKGKLGEINDVVKKIEQSSQDLVGFGMKIGAMGAALAATLAVPVKAAADFEQAMAKVKSLSGATEAEFAKLSETAKELGRTTKFTAEEAAEGMSFLAMAGFKTTEIIGAMPSVLQLAAAANLDLASAADITSNILTGYGMKVEELARVNDVLVKAFTSANTDLTQLGQAMKFVGPVASSAGVAFEETAAAVGLLGNAGIQATMAGTSLRKIITSLINPVGDSKKKLEELGITVTDQEGRFIGLSNVISQFEEAFKSVGGEADRTSLIMSLFGDRAGPAMAALIDQGSGALDTFTENLKNAGGIAESISQTQMATLKGSLTLLKSAISGLLISIGEPFLKSFAKAAELFAALVTKVTAFKEALGPLGTIVFGVVGALGALLVVAGALSIAVGGIGLVISSIVTGFTAWTTLMPLLIAGVKAVIVGLSGLTSSLISAAAAAGVLNTALSLGLVGAAIAAGYSIGKLIDYLIRGRKEQEELAKSAERTAQALQNTARNESELEQGLTSLGFTVGTTDQKWQAYNKAIEDGIVVWDEQAQAYKRVERAIVEQQKTYEDFLAAVEEGSEEFLKIRQAEASTLKATIDYEIALEEQKHKSGEVSLKEYLSFREGRMEEYVRHMIDLKNIELEFLSKEPEKNLDKIKATEEEIKQLKIASASEQLKIQQELTDGLKESYTKDLDNWKALQELKLQSLQAALDLQNTIEETMVKQGLMRQSDLLANQLNRLREFYAERIRIAEETMMKVWDSEGVISKAYQEASAERERLQRELEGKLIESEAKIKEARKKEELEAAKFIAEITKETAELQVIEQEKLRDEVERLYRLRLISAEQYYDALSELDKTYVSKFKAELQEWTRALNEAARVVADRRKGLQDSVKSLIEESWGDVKQYFGDWKTAVKTTISDVQYQIDNFMQNTTWKSYNVFWNANLFGRKMIQMIGTTIYEWASRVADYINYIKGLMASLQDTIESYRQQLMQLRGDRLGELDLWYGAEKAKLAEKFKDELGQTKEYYDALKLLDELYAEKKKKVIEEMKKDQEQLTDADLSGSGSGAGGYSGGSLVPPSFLSDFGQQIKENLSGVFSDFSEQFMTVTTTGTTVETKNFNFDASFELPSLDPQATDRWIRDVFWPRLENFMKLKGICL